MDDVDTPFVEMRVEGYRGDSFRAQERSSVDYGVVDSRVEIYRCEDRVSLSFTTVSGRHVTIESESNAREEL